MMCGSTRAASSTRRPAASATRLAIFSRSGRGELHGGGHLDLDEIGFCGGERLVGLAQLGDEAEAATLQQKLERVGHQRLAALVISTRMRCFAALSTWGSASTSRSDAEAARAATKSPRSRPTGATAPASRAASNRARA